LKSGVIIGTIQAIAMVPGVSRSAATILGGLTQKLTRKAAAEFSFFLAVPTMFAATIKSIWDSKELLAASGNNEIMILVVGNVVAFIVAYLAIKSFIGFLTKRGFLIFGYYRIIVGLILLGLILGGYEFEMI
jgi:undecaprenyl-diphosphatase